ncbi:BTB domain-containing protein [Mycena indigotica]|uniref:BTB domain-containing protein n=1 Tax=Mycena indigotica TaxID=2126181 RepID=A0A8H6RZT4_9AGAR|nr:BTB domain-containing protein [Mycena indigotica]KAF7289703.1 BTB domain-containing protein [Mycena indigotica]
MNVDRTVKAPPPARADGLWFSDCGLVLRAENTVFRVSRDFMATHSRIFRDMLALGPAPTDAETFDGCPLVGLPDSAEDTTKVLKGLLYHDFLSFNATDNTIAVLLSILRMAHKYEVSSLLKRSLHHVSLLFPTTLAALDTSGQRHQKAAGPGPGVDWPTVILTARRVSMEWMLPVAFYWMCSPTYEGAILRSPLSVEDKQRWVVGLRQLDTQERWEVLAFLSAAPNPGCPSKEQCAQSRASVRLAVDQFMRSRPAEPLGLPLHLWGPVSWNSLEAQVCPLCVADMRAAHRAARESLWARLPQIFDLPSWVTAPTSVPISYFGNYPKLGPIGERLPMETRAVTSNVFSFSQPSTMGAHQNSLMGSRSFAGVSDPIRDMTGIPHPLLATRAFCCWQSFVLGVVKGVV